MMGSRNRVGPPINIRIYVYTYNIYLYILFIAHLLYNIFAASSAVGAKAAAAYGKEAERVGYVGLQSVGMLTAIQEQLEFRDLDVVLTFDI